MTVQRESPPLPGRADVAVPKPAGGSLLRATLWTLGGEAASHPIRLISSLVLTRLLVPADFGIMALVQVFMYGLNMFSDLGIRPIIIRHERGEDPAFLNTAWTVRLIRGAVLWLVACGLAWPAAQFYGKPQIALLLPVASATLFLEGFLATKFFTHERRLSRARPTLINLSSSIAGVSVMILWAWFHPTVWALVLGGLVGTLSKVVLSHVVLSGPGNRLQWDPAAWKEVTQFGKWVFLNSMVTFFAMQLDKLVFAKMIPFEMLGVYAIAANIVQLPSTAVQAVGSGVAFPAFSRAKDRLEEFTRIFSRMRLLLFLGGGAGLSFLIFNGPWIIALLYDPRYEAAGWMIQIAALGGWGLVLEVPHGLALLSVGQPRWLTVAGALKVVAWLVAVPLGYRFAKFPGALCAASAVEALRFLVESVRVSRAGLKGRRLELLASVWVLAGTGIAFLIHRGALDPGSVVQRGAISVLAFSILWVPVGVWWASTARRSA